MLLKANQSVYVPSLHPVFRDLEFRSHIYYSIGKTARTLGVPPCAVQNHLKSGTLRFVKVNARIFIPTFAIRIDAPDSAKPPQELPTDDLSLLLLMEEEDVRGKVPPVREFLDLPDCFIAVLTMEDGGRKALACRCSGEDRRLVGAAAQWTEEEFQTARSNLLRGGLRDMRGHFPEERWTFGEAEIRSSLEPL